MSLSFDFLRSGLESMGRELVKNHEHAESMSSFSKYDHAEALDKHHRRISLDELHDYSNKGKPFLYQVFI